MSSILSSTKNALCCLQPPAAALMAEANADGQRRATAALLEWIEARGEATAAAAR